MRGDEKRDISWCEVIIGCIINSELIHNLHTHAHTNYTRIYKTFSMLEDVVAESIETDGYGAVYTLKK